METKDILVNWVLPNKPQKITDGEIHVWQINLDQEPDNLLALLSQDEISRMDRLKMPDDKIRFILAHGALRAILGDYLAISGALINFDQGELGKPFITCHKTTIEFNLSHCGEMALLAVSANSPVGIDVERITTRPSQLKIAKRMFPEAAYATLSTLPPEELGTAFLQYWTEFEARAKYSGNGIFSNTDKHKKNHIKHFIPEQGWIACVALMQEIEAVNWKYFNYRN